MVMCHHFLCMDAIDGDCPIALSDEYAACCIDFPESCEDCLYFFGCCGCFLTDENGICLYLQTV